MKNCNDLPSLHFFKLAPVISEKCRLGKSLQFFSDMNGISSIPLENNATIVLFLFVNSNDFRLLRKVGWLSEDVERHESQLGDHEDRIAHLEEAVEKNRPHKVRKFVLFQFFILF